MNRTLKACWVLIFCVSTMSAVAQQITVRLIDGKSGKPIVDQNVTFDFLNETRSVDVVARTDRYGEAVVPVPSGMNKVSLSEGPKKGKEPGRIAYLDCNSGGLVLLDINQVRLNGFVPANACGKFKAPAKLGTIVFYAQTIPWYVPDMQ